MSECEPRSQRKCPLTRRDFLRSAGAGTALLAAGPYVAGVGRADESQVLGEAEDRIRKHRMGQATLSFVGPDGQALPAGVPVQIRQTRHKFLFGCNIFKLGRCRTPEHNQAYGRQFAELLNFATLPFYWWNYERQKGRPQDERTEEIISWCNEHDIAMKGHPLAWNYVDPPWLSGTPQEAMDLQMRRIKRCVRRFRGDITMWDVVNEATHYDRDQCKERSPKLTAAIARMGIGDYVRTAFKAARQANPGATLLINDYRTDPAYPEKVISELVDSAGKPLYDVIGIQSHMHGRYWGAARAWETCERFTRFGKPLHFTETTVVSGPKRDSGWTTTAEGEVQQARFVTEFYTVLFSHPAVEAITWWDFTDQNAWQRAPAGLLRDDMTSKPVYEQLYDLIKGTWWTMRQAETNAAGQVDFRGFLGRYAVKADRLRGAFALDGSSERPVEIRLE
jgi:GH35 family endo-1,4-beta-xylanase